MAEEKITLDSFDKQIRRYKRQDLQKKVDIACNILKKCEHKMGHKVVCPITKTSILSGVPLETLVLINSLEQKTKKFEDWFLDQKRQRHDYSFVYYKMRTQLVDSYIKQQKIPQWAENKNELEYNKKFFTTIQIPGTKASIVVEKPETVLERHRFLYTKMMHREANRHIVYVGKVNIFNQKGKFSYKEDNCQIKSVFMIAASPTIGHIAYIYCCGSNQEYQRNWIEEKVLPELPAESLVIFQENVLNCLGFDPKPVDIYSTKTEMMNWLTTNKIPHDPTMHKADLYKLISDFKRTSIGKLATAEEVLRAHGHITLKKTKCNLDNNYFDPFWDFLMHELNNSTQTLPKAAAHHHHYSAVITHIANVIVQNTPVEYWKGLDNMLQDTEREIYREDLEMEYIIDKLLTMAKHEELSKDCENIPQHKYGTVKEKQYIFLADIINKYMNDK